jgi:hypothetical protein
MKKAVYIFSILVSLFIFSCTQNAGDLTREKAKIILNEHKDYIEKRVKIKMTDKSTDNSDSLSSDDFIKKLIEDGYVKMAGPDRIALNDNLKPYILGYSDDRLVGSYIYSERDDCNSGDCAYVALKVADIVCSKINGFSIEPMFNTAVVKYKVKMVLTDVGKLYPRKIEDIQVARRATLQKFGDGWRLAE